VDCLTLRIKHTEVSVITPSPAIVGRSCRTLTSFAWACKVSVNARLLANCSVHPKRNTFSHVPRPKVEETIGFT
jgi:hypothetical protein